MPHVVCGVVSFFVDKTKSVLGEINELVTDSKWGSCEFVDSLGLYVAGYYGYK